MAKRAHGRRHQGNSTFNYFLSIGIVGFEGRARTIIAGDTLSVLIARATLGMVLGDKSQNEK